jgi:uncharacterized C2H2 Zn-finger protein
VIMYSCAICGKTFGRLGNLQRHQRNFHATTRRPWERKVDEQPPIAASSNVSTDKRPCFNELVDDDAIFEHGCEVLKCDICEMYFLSQEELDKHKKV